MSINTLLGVPEEIICRGCQKIFLGGADSARRHDWRVGWNPSMPTWCPLCYGSPRVNPKARREAADALLEATDPLF